MSHTGDKGVDSEAQKPGVYIRKVRGFGVLTQDWLIQTLVGGIGMQFH